MYTSPKNKPLHHAVGSPMNPRRMGFMSHLNLSAVTISLTFLFVFSMNSKENLKYQILYLTKRFENRSKFKS